MKIGIPLLKLTLNVSLLFGVINLFICEISGKNNDLEATNKYIELNVAKPKHYDIRFGFNKLGEIVNAECIIKIFIKTDTQYIRLHAHGKPYVEIFEAYVTNHSLGLRYYPTNNYVYEINYYSTNTIPRTKHHFIRFDFAETIPHGDYDLRIYFNNLANDEVVFKIPFTLGRWLFATHLKPTRSRELFPCFDDPRLRTSFNITILHHVNHTVFSNMPIASTDKINSTMIWTHFLETSKMSTHDIAVVAIHKDFFSHSIMWFRKHLAPTQLEFAKMIATKVTNSLKNKWWFKNIRNATHVVIPGFPYDAMMKWGLNIFREEAILLDVNGQLLHKAEVARLIARVVAYEQLNKMVITSWRYQWLHEGIAMLLGQDIIEKAYPNYCMSALFVVQIHQESLRWNTHPFTHSLMRETNNNLDIINTNLGFYYYIKAPVLLYMLQRGLTDEIFWTGIRHYLDYAKISDFDMFCTAMQDAYSELGPASSLNIKEMIHGWVKQKQYPVLTVRLIFQQFVTNESNIMQSEMRQYIKIHVDNFYKLDLDTVWLPITITTQSNLNFTLTTWERRRDLRHMPEYLLDTNLIWPSNFIPENDWIIVNVQQIGYYRVKYDVENWDKLARYLDSTNYTNIHVLNRAQIIDDAFYFLMKDEIDLFTFSCLTKYLSRETDYMAWYPVIKMFQYMSGFIPYSRSAFIKEKFRVLVDDYLKRIGYEEQLTEHQYRTVLRKEALKWSFIFGSEFSQKQADDKLYTLKLNDNDLKISSSEWKEWIFCNGLNNKNRNYFTWKNLFELYTNRTDNNDNDKLIKYITCPDHPMYAVSVISSIIYDKEIRIPILSKGMRNYINIFHSIIAKHAKNAEVFQHLMRRFELFKPSKISTIVALSDLINHVYDISQLYEIYEYVQKHMSNEVSLWLLQCKISMRVNEIRNQRKYFSVFF